MQRIGSPTWIVFFVIASFIVYMTLVLVLTLLGYKLTGLDVNLLYVGVLGFFVALEQITKKYAK